jgi:hypothetical protein
MSEPKLCTLHEWNNLPPATQGYVLYMQEALPGSELKGQVNPHPPFTIEWQKFRAGELRAVLDAQDSEE